MILFHDTETSGFINPNENETHSSQPHLVQLGLLLCDDDAKELATVELIVRPNGYNIPDGAAKVHGITTALATRAGVPLLVAVAAFTNLRALADRLVAHNLPFDDMVMRAAIHRTGKTPSSPGPMNRSCTMTMAGEIMNLPPTAKMKAAGFDKYKPPNLTEAHRHFTGEDFAGAHGALADCRACARVYFEILRNQK
jgi:DNA polymerase-3 subunit epsilon